VRCAKHQHVRNAANLPNARQLLLAAPTPPPDVMQKAPVKYSESLFPAKERGSALPPSYRVFYKLPDDVWRDVLATVAMTQKQGLATLEAAEQAATECRLQSARDKQLAELRAEWELKNTVSSQPLAVTVGGPKFAGRDLRDSAGGTSVTRSLRSHSDAQHVLDASVLTADSLAAKAAALGRVARQVAEDSHATTDSAHEAAAAPEFPLFRSLLALDVHATLRAAAEASETEAGAGVGPATGDSLDGVQLDGAQPATPIIALEVAAGAETQLVRPAWINPDPDFQVGAVTFNTWNPFVSDRIAQLRDAYLASGASVPGRVGRNVAIPMTHFANCLAYATVSPYNLGNVNRRGCTPGKASGHPLDVATWFPTWPAAAIALSPGLARGWMDLEPILTDYAVAPVGATYPGRTLRVRNAPVGACGALMTRHLQDGLRTPGAGYLAPAAAAPPASPSATPTQSSTGTGSPSQSATGSASPTASASPSSSHSHGSSCTATATQTSTSSRTHTATGTTTTTATGSGTGTATPSPPATTSPTPTAGTVVAGATWHEVNVFAHRQVKVFPRDPLTWVPPTTHHWHAIKPSAVLNGPDELVTLAAGAALPFGYTPALVLSSGMDYHYSRHNTPIGVAAATVSDKNGETLPHGWNADAIANDDDFQLNSYRRLATADQNMGRTVTIATDWCGVLLSRQHELVPVGSGGVGRGDCAT